MQLDQFKTVNEESPMKKAELIEALVKHSGADAKAPQKKRVAPTLITGGAASKPEFKGSSQSKGNETMSQAVKEIEKKAKAGGYGGQVAFELSKPKGKAELMTLPMAELRKYAKGRDVTGVGKMKRFEIIMALEQAKKLKKKRKQKHLEWKKKHDKGISTKSPHHIIEIPARAVQKVL